MAVKAFINVFPVGVSDLAVTCPSSSPREAYGRQVVVQLPSMEEVYLRNRVARESNPFDGLGFLPRQASSADPRFGNESRILSSLIFAVPVGESGRAVSILSAT